MRPDLIFLLFLPLAWWVRFMSREISYKYRNPLVRIAVFCGLMLVVSIIGLVASAAVQDLSAWNAR